MEEIIYNRCDGLITKLTKIGEKQYINQYGIVIDLNKCAILGKTSYNVIDLIEVGDYVNGEKVGSIETVEVITEAITSAGIDGRVISITDIKTIVTKEQFKNMEYEV